MNLNISINNLSQKNIKKNNSNNVSFTAYKCIRQNRWRYSDKWIDNIMSQLSKNDRQELTEIYGGPKRASSLEVINENTKGLFYPITRFCSKLFAEKKCIKVVEDPHKYPYAIRKEFYSDGSRKEMSYGALKELINMNEINKDGITTRSIQYNWDCGDYTIRIYDENRKVTKVYPSIKHPYYPRIRDS